MKSLWRPRDRTLLYRVTEVVGAWSMVDIFLVGLLSALVSLGALSTIRPGIGAIFFAGAVVTPEKRKMNQTSRYFYYFYF